MFIKTEDLPDVLNNGTHKEVMFALKNSVIPPFFVSNIVKRGNHQEIMALIGNKFTDLVAAAYPILMRGNHKEIMFLLKKLPNNRVVGVTRIILRGEHEEIMYCIKKWGRFFYKLDEELLYRRNIPTEISSYEKQKNKASALS